MGMPSWCTLTDVTVGLRHASVLPLDLFDGLLDPATRSQLAVLWGYGVLGVAGQATSLLGLDSCLFLPELCLTTAKAADAAPPSKNRPLLIGAAMADKGRKRCSNHDSKADVTEIDAIICSSPGSQQQAIIVDALRILLEHDSHLAPG